jgi:hypothetical protein
MTALLKQLARLTIIAAVAVACAQVPAPGNPAFSSSPTPTTAAPPTAKLLPAQKRQLLIIGQDMSSVNAYVESGQFPPPGGVTTYLAFYQLLNSNDPAWGALGEDRHAQPTGIDVDWGAGRLNANSAALGFRQSSLVIGLSIAEGNAGSLWAKGGLAAIGRGEHDDKIQRLARFCKDIDKPVYLRIGYEFDGAWNRGYENTAAYIAAFRRIVDGLRHAGANKVAFVWQASASPIDDVIDAGHERIEDWYPGDDYVDWMGLSWFLRADEGPQPAITQRQLADEVLAWARARDKPVMIAEAAPQGYDLEQLTRANSSPLRDGPTGQSRQQKTADEIWQEWFVPFFDYIDLNRDVIRAVAYINADWDSQSMWRAPYRQGYWGDSRIQANPSISARWRQHIADESTWLHGGPQLESQLLR